MFTTPQRVDPEKLKQAAQVEKLLKKLEAFLQEPSGTEGLSNNELLNTNLQKIPTDKRPAVKEARKALMELVMNEYKMPIKNALLDNVVRKIRSGLSDEDKGTGADIGIEGIVLRDQQTGEQIKIVDKDIFTAINTFNQSIRQTVQSSLTTVDPDSPLEQRGGLVGELRIRIAELFGNREMAKASNTRKVLEPLKGKSPEEAIENMAKSMGAIEDHEAIKKKILAMVSDTASQLKSKLEEFKANQKNYKLQLTNGKEISLSDDTIKRTLLTFAEARKNLLIIFDHLKQTTTLAQILAVLYGGQAKAVHAPKIDEGLLLEKKVKRKTTQAQDVDRHEYDKRDVFQLVNSYLATVFMTMLVWHEDDKPGMRILRDRKNMGLKNWSSDMSPFNHWGYVIWRNNKPDLKKQLSKKVQHELFATTRQIQAPRWRFLHIDFSTNRDVKVDWADHRKTLQRLIDLTRLRSDRLNTLLDKLIRFPDLSHDEKLSAVKKLHTFAMQFVPRSVMLSRLKIIERALTNGKDDQMVTESKLLKSISALAEDEGGEGVYTQPVSVAGTTSAAIAPVQSRVAREATIIKRKRNPSVKRLTMKFPDPRKENE
jgi:hypothetical protein